MFTYGPRAGAKCFEVERWPLVSGGSTVLLLLIDNPWIADTCFLLSERFYRSGPGRWESDTFSQCRKQSFDITD